VRVYHSKLKHSPLMNIGLFSITPRIRFFICPVLRSADGGDQVTVYRDSKPSNISHWCRVSSGVDSLLILIFINTQADGIPSLPAFGSDESFFFWSVRPLGFYFQLDKPAIDQLRVAPALLDATRCNNPQTSFADANKHDNLSPVCMPITSALSKP
jgi:hypothetical protein